MKVDSDSPPFSELPAESASYYDRNAATYSTTNQNPAEFIDEFLSHMQEGGTILDLGSGPGINAEYMHSRNFQVIGIDLSEKMVEYARSRYPDIDFRLADMAKLPFTAETFGGILASYSLIHLRKEMIPSVLAKLYEILKQGGIIYLSVQSGNSMQGLFSHPVIPGDQVFLNIFAKEEICGLLSGCGFEIVSQYEKPPQGKVFNFTKLFVIAKKTSRATAR